ncbi:class I SAM-dependent methyltransferase [Actinomadura sp. DC4]|uniref:class I SAM-dependent methyltransferase n=1 Tax=Actinomadura sp. DC4 TaxID=3055069 RepID=UPI0025AF4B49|nr:class I SAM-dependent methyltransferase [Actinomadura sp. DC4]MDN3356949.1 class I SAM-dependent methyltransferase [Actinomadura sp. DC4]
MIWDETLYAGAAGFYARGRLPYAPGLAPALAEMLALDGRGRLLDVGCGPGTLALLLAPLFGEVVGVDADAGMIVEAARRSAGIRWIHARAEDLPEGLGTFSAVSFGQSFHWMERDLVAATVHGLLRPGGAFVHVSDVKGESPAGGGLPRPPYAGIEGLVRRHLGPVRRAGRGLLPQGTPGGEAAVLARAGFAGPVRRVVPGGEVLERSASDVLAWVFSLSSSAPHLFGDRRAGFERDLLRLLREVSPSGRFAEVRPGTEVLVWRRAG